MSVDIVRVQARLLEIAKQVTSILESHNIPHMLSYGTLLGAIRHQGFIPWDDDFDLFLFDDESYEKARVALKNNLSEDLFLEDEDTEKKFFHAWSRVSCKKTEKHSNIYPLDNVYENQGLFLDLYKIKKIKFHDFDKHINEEFSRFLNRLKNNNLISDEDLKNKSAPKKKYIGTENKNNDRELFVAIGAKPSGYELDDILPLKKHKFEDSYFYVPNNYHNVLKIFYGDYMEIPPEEDRKSHYDSVIFKDKT
jgi:lipopolysaccharide cholinephosphotransferase